MIVKTIILDFGQTCDLCSGTRDTLLSLQPETIPSPAKVSIVASQFAIQTSFIFCLLRRSYIAK